MGKAMSMLARKANRFNAENRAHRFLDKAEKVVAPKFEADLKSHQKLMEDQPEIIEKLNKKDTILDDRLKQVYVTSADKVADRPKENVQYQKNLPSDRKTVDDFEYGYKEPERVPKGKCSLRQAMDFLSSHHEDPKEWTAKKIANQYELKEQLVYNILANFHTFKVYIPDATKQKGQPSITEGKWDLLEGPHEKPKEKSDTKS